jgi:4-amino-4-deoxy-L-arabinose transferase-like glycosyltransferase
MGLTPARTPNRADEATPCGLPKPAFLKPWAVLLFFGLLVTALRFSAFFAAQIGWDESLYLLVADQWVQGHPPYTTVWDNKPPGIYTLFAIALKIFGHSVVGIRILACVFVTATCFILYRIGDLFEREGWLIGILAGTLFALLSVIDDSLGANTEVFFTTFTTLAFAIVLSRDDLAGRPGSRNWRTWGLAGLVLGCGFELKYNVLFDVAALGAISGLRYWKQPASGRKSSTLIRDLVSLGTGFSLPFLGVTLLFVLTHRFEDYCYANFTANRIRTVDHAYSPLVLLRGIAGLNPRILLFWVSLPCSLLYLLFVKEKGSRERWIMTAMLVWSTTVVLGVAFTFRVVIYQHYFLQVLPAISLLSAALLARLFFRNVVRSETAMPRKRWISLVALMLAAAYPQALGQLLLGAKHVYFGCVKGQKHWADWDAQAADYIGARIRPEDYIYVVDNQPVLYFLTRARIPTRYAFPPFLVTRKDLPNITGIDPLQELDRIMKTHPVYVVKNIVEADPNYTLEDSVFFEVLNRHLAQDYFLEKTLTNVNLYRLKVRS